MPESDTTCPNGHDNPGGSRFCETCGSAIQQSASDAPPASTAVPPAPRAAPGEPQSRGGGISMRMAVLVAAIIGIGAAAATGGLVYFLAGSDDDEPAAPGPTPTTAAVATTAAPMDTPTEPPAAATATPAPGATRESALALGVPKRGFNGWELKVIRADFDAVQAVMAENPLNELPDAGNTYILVRVQAMNVEAGDASEFETFTFRITDAAGREYRHYSETCGVYPDSFAFIDTVVDQGRSVEGNLCYQVPLDEIADMVFFDDASDTWFALR